MCDMWLFGEREKQCVQMKIAPKISSDPVGEKSMEALYYGIVSGLYPYPPVRGGMVKLKVVISFKRLQVIFIHSYSPPFPCLTVVGRERGAGTSSTQIVVAARE